MRGYFGIAVYHPKHEVNVGTLWRSAYTYGASFIATIGKRYERQAADTCNSPDVIPLHHYDSVAELIDRLPHGCPLVGVELDQRSVALNSFGHPPRALYLLGAEDHGLPDAVLNLCHYVVQIPTPQPWSLNLAVAGSLVMADRYTKAIRPTLASAVSS